MGTYIFQVRCERNWMICIEPWPQPHPTPSGCTGIQTANQTLSPSISVGPHWCSCGLMGANTCSQAPTSGVEPETRRVKAVNDNGFGMMCSIITYRWNVWVSTYLCNVVSLYICHVEDGMKAVSCMSLGISQERQHFFQLTLTRVITYCQLVSAIN